MAGEDFNKDLLSLIKSGEGSIDHMYLDTVSKVTVGVGNMLPNAAAAQALAFLQRSDNTPATQQQIADEFSTVSKQQPGKIASSYKVYTKLYLTDAAIDALLQKRLDQFTVQLQKDFPDWATYPDPAKLALTDMAFNLGNAGLVNGFPSLTHAAKNKNWNECANQCNRKGIADSRNAETKALFLEAARS